jgi:hypothetical protein
MKLGVFVHTNEKQHLGALVSAYSMRRASPHADQLRIEIIRHEDHPFLQAREGQTYLVGGEKRVWRNEDLQSFTPLRFLPPELMAYEGRAVVVDPDVFAAGDIWELLTRDMGGEAIMCRRRPPKKTGPGGWATSVMLLDCAKLRHWRAAEGFGELFALKRDYVDWIELQLEDQSTIGPLEDEWNDFDRLTPATKLVHNTKRNTQPWKSGLPVDFVTAEKFRLFPPKGWLSRGRRLLFGDYAFAGSYERHPDPNQERFFFGLLKECLEQGVVTEAMLREEMARNHVRHDALEVVARTPRLGRTPFSPPAERAA